MQVIQKKPWMVLDATVLKIIAIAAMLIDHLGATVYPQHRWMRMVGRLTLPIMAFFIAEGAAKTKNKRAYALRLLIFALISEIPFDLVFSRAIFSFRMQNIFFTLSFGLIACYMADNIRQWQSQKPVRTILSALVLILLVAAGELLRVDYGGLGVVLVLLFYLGREKMSGPIYAMVVGNGLMAVAYGVTQLYAFAALPLLYLYNGERGMGLKYMFYAFYPLHLLIIWAARFV